MSPSSTEIDVMPPPTRRASDGPIREDFREILRLVRPGSRVLDIGCGEGALLDLLQREKGIDGRGLEISEAGVSACLARGLAVVQGDADRDLFDYPARAFDYAILSQTLQTVREPKRVLEELLRIAGRAVVSFPNFGHWRVRWGLMTKGRMPLTGSLPTRVNAAIPSLGGTVHYRLVVANASGRTAGGRMLLASH